MQDRAARAAGKIRHAHSGSVAIMVALSLSVLLGFSALGTEIVYAMFKQRQMQATANAAALAGATAMMTGHPAVPKTEALAVAATAGFADKVGSTTVRFNSPPLTGAYTVNAGAVEVIVAQPQSLPLSSLFHSGTWNISARAVATKGSSGTYCALELDPTNAGAVSMSNGAHLTLNQCGLAVNATGSAALSVIGGATVSASTVSVGGTTSVNNGGSITTTNGVQTSQPAVADPYSGTVVPTVGACKYGSPGNPYTVLGWQNPTLSPGVYCGGVAMGNGGTVTMSPGVYIISGGTFSVQGIQKLIGTGVTIFLTGSGSNYAIANLANGVAITLSAPTTGATSGLLFYGDPAAPHTSINYLQGGTNMVLTGALYFPSEQVAYGNGTITAATCTQLIAWRMTFTGGALFNSNCGSAGTAIIGGGGASALVE